MNIRLLTFDSLESTNTEALEQARLGADEGVCVIARQQTAGRGRHGRTWVSPKDAGLYFSIVLRPKLDMRDLPLITLMTGVAVHETLADLGIAADIKWVNDILVDEKKICGILAETTETASGLAVIVGIGINIRASNFPPEIADTATSIEQAGPGEVATGDVVASLTRCLSRFYEMLGVEPRSIIDEWSHRSTYFSGKRVRVVLESDTVLGVTDGLESNGALRVRQDDGSIAIIQAGDVEQLRPST
jgi:BirA family biotin operon repressor/biotin-[acetyl-CoA-carboxylase] ligase